MGFLELRFELNFLSSSDSICRNKEDLNDDVKKEVIGTWKKMSVPKKGFVFNVPHHVNADCR